MKNTHRVREVGERERERGVSDKERERERERERMFVCVSGFLPYHVLHMRTWLILVNV